MLCTVFVDVFKTVFVAGRDDSPVASVRLVHHGASILQRSPIVPAYPTGNKLIYLSEDRACVRPALAIFFNVRSASLAGGATFAIIIHGAAARQTPPCVRIVYSGIISQVHDACVQANTAKIHKQRINALLLNTN